MRACRRVFEPFGGMKFTISSLFARQLIIQKGISYIEMRRHLSASGLHIHGLQYLGCVLYGVLKQ